MNLIIDIGNTQTKVAVVEGEEIKKYEAFKRLDVNLLEPILLNFAPQKAILGAVGEIPQGVVEWLKERVKLHVAGPYSLTPLINDYSTPQTLGFDRIAVAVGAHYLYPGRNLLVIDAGTAITYEVVTSNGHYKGGAISPGLRLRFQALHAHTARLPLIDPNPDAPLVGTSTTECILSGVINGAVGEMDGFIEKISSIYDDCVVVLTGGDSKFFANKLKNSIFVNPYLMVLGLNRILEFNVEK